MTIQLGLERIRQLMGAMNDPQDKIQTIHVAGTNGKGSVVAYISAVLTQIGKRVGSFTSPHLIHPRDCIRINKQAIGEDTYKDTMDTVKSVNKSHKINASPFELMTATAFLVFERLRVDVAVIEVGMGGLLDATNCISKPLVAVITPIGFDHMDFLGDTIESIVRHKAGIIKEGCAVVVGKQYYHSALLVVENVAAKLHCECISAESILEFASPTDKMLQVAFCGILQTIPVVLEGEFQLDNVCTAVACLQSLVLHYGFQISGDQLSDGLKRVEWPGRLEWLKHDKLKGRRVLLDGAHNLMAVNALAEFVNDIRSQKSVEWIVAFTKTKPVSKILECLVQQNDVVHAVPFNQPQDMPWIECQDAQIVAEEAKRITVNVQQHHSVADAIEQCSLTNDTLVVICGSLYVVADVYRFLEI